MRRWRRSKLVRGPSNATISPSTMKSSLRCERADQLGVGLVQRLAGPRQQPQPASVAEGQAALAVQFALVDPSGVGEALVGQHGQHRRCPFRLLLRPQQFPGPRRESVQRAGHAAPSAPVLVGGAPCGFPQTARLTREAELASWEGRAGVLGERPAGSTSRRPSLIAPPRPSRTAAGCAIDGTTLVATNQPSSPSPVAAPRITMAQSSTTTSCASSMSVIQELEVGPAPPGA